MARADRALGRAEAERHHFDRQRETAERRDPFGAVGDHHHAGGRRRDDLFPQQRPAPALDQGQVGRDLVGAVDGEIELGRLVERGERGCRTARPARASPRRSAPRSRRGRRARARRAARRTAARSSRCRARAASPAGRTRGRRPRHRACRLSAVHAVGPAEMDGRLPIAGAADGGKPLGQSSCQPPSARVSAGAMPAPTIVFDLDGTLVDTAPDLIDTLNVILRRHDVAGGGVRRRAHDDRRGRQAAAAARARLQGTAVPARRDRPAVRRISRALRRAHRRPLAAVSGSGGRARRAGGGRLPARGLHQQARMAVGAAARCARPVAAFRGDLRAGHLPDAQARSRDAAPDHRAGRRRCRATPSWSATR